MLKFSIELGPCSFLSYGRASKPVINLESLGFGQELGFGWTKTKNQTPSLSEFHAVKQANKGRFGTFLTPFASDFNISLYFKIQNGVLNHSHQ